MQFQITFSQTTRGQITFCSNTLTRSYGIFVRCREIVSLTDIPYKQRKYDVRRAHSFPERRISREKPLGAFLEGQLPTTRPHLIRDFSDIPNVRDFETIHKLKSAFFIE